MSPTTSRVLLVDDSALMRHMAAATLRSAGYEVVDEAEDAAKALEMISAATYDAMVVDYHMPGMDGLRLVAHVRSLPEAHDMSILMVTSERDCCVENEARDAGADAFLCKPVHPARLNAKIRELVSLRRGDHVGRMLLQARRIVEAIEVSAIIIDRRHELVAGNDAFWDELASGEGRTPVTSCGRAHAEGEIPPECPLREVEITGCTAERTIEDGGVVVRVSVSVLDFADENGEPLYLHVASPVV